MIQVPQYGSFGTRSTTGAVRTTTTMKHSPIRLVCTKGLVSNEMISLPDTSTRDGREAMHSPALQESLSDKVDSGLENQHEEADLARVDGDDGTWQYSRVGQADQAEQAQAEHAKPTLP